MSFAGILLLASSTLLNMPQAQEKTAKEPGMNTKKTETVWVDACSLTIEGRGFTDMDSPYDRLPGRAKGVVPEDVWNMSRQPSGMTIRFMTDAKRIKADLTIHSRDKLLPSMTVQGAEGLDCYGRDSTGKWCWAGSLNTGHDTSTHITAAIHEGELDGKKREYAVYLPLCSKVDKLRIGTEGGTLLEPVVRMKQKPVVYYGTSIAQGVTATRPGMSHIAILGRRLGIPFVNAGFSGCGRMDSTVVSFLGEIDASLFIIDCLPNMGDKVTEKTVMTIEQLRRMHPATPILFIGDRLFGNASFVPVMMQIKKDRDAAQRQGIEQCKKQGIKGLHLFDNPNTFGNDFEGNADGSHASDLGSMRFAQALAPVISKLVK